MWGPSGVVVSMLSSHAVDPSLNPGSDRILTGTSLVDFGQSNVRNTTSERLASSPSSLNVHVMKLEINA